MSSKTRVLGNSFLYTISSLLVKAIGFILLPVYTFYLSPEDYGITNLVNSFTQVATFIVAFSLYSAVVRFYTDFKDDNDKLKRFYGTVTIFVCISGAVFVSLGFLFHKVLITWFFEGIPFFPVVVISLLTLTFVSIHTVHQSILQGMQQGKKLTIINLVVFGIQICITLFFIGVLKLGAVGVLLAILIINIGYFLFSIFDLKKNNLITFCIDIKILKETLKYSIPIMPHNLSTNIASFTSRIFINNNGTLASVGLYSVANQFGALIDTVQSSVNNAFAPWFYDMMNNGNKESKSEIVNLSHFLLIIYSLIYMGVGLFSQEVIILITNERYIIAWTIIPILVVAYSVKSIYYFYVNILFYYKDASRKLFIATLTGSFADIILAYVMVSKFGMYGAAFSFMIAKIIVVAMVIFISKRYDDLGYKVTGMLKIILPSLLFMGVGLYFSYTKYMTEFSWSNFFYKITILLAYLLYIYFTNRNMIKKIISSGNINYLLRRTKNTN
ncbi:lipopolysaccharide biosynthesis protein [Schinkia azotoformans]|uniref:lipopolysaccharide biosynthesis protein n=1 Tax=Schinkia azotoformans TaxID=1454 RepID=UPI002DB934D0|nr:oligosaccharide flippase family protein [Schinkia azotoformans]MEC1760390.1 oligosaccharide flippase family protein [Schinkia azotoformans]